MTINATAAILLALYVAVARRRGIPEAALSGTVQNDILKEYVARGTYIYPARAVAAPRDRRPRLLRASASRAGTRSRSPATTSARRGPRRPQEIAFTFAHALEYVRAAQAAGPRSRAASASGCRSSSPATPTSSRRWRSSGPRAGSGPRIMKERFGVDEPARPSSCASTSRPGGVTLTAQQPDNNVVRVALQALAAVLGGCQSLHTNGKDEALALPTEASARLALRTQQVIAFETGVADTVDPAGRLVRGRGGDRPRSRREAVRAPRPHRGQGRRAAGHRAGRDPARDPGVGLPLPEPGGGGRAGRSSGVNRFAGGGRGAADGHPAHRPRASSASRSSASAPCARARRRRALARRPSTRSETARAAARTSMPALIDAVLAWATVGEIAGRLREVFGEHRETLVL